MFASLLLAATVFLGGSKAAGDAALVGTWAIDGHPFLVFKSDGTGTMEGEGFTWTADGKVIRVKSTAGEQDQMSYVIQNEQLALVAGGIPMALTRLGKASKSDDSAAKAAAPASVSAKEKPSGKSAKDPALSKQDVGGGLAKLLVSSPWCTFHYNQTSGTSSSSRVLFHPDGTWEKSHRGETYSSGYGGTFAGQSDSAEGGKWKVENNLLYMSSGETNGQFAPLQLFVTKNSNGYPILNANGDEYSSCK